MTSKLAPGKFIKFASSIENYIDTDFLNAAPISSVLHFMTASGFGSEIIKAVFTQYYCIKHGLAFKINDQFWNARCSDEGLKCYFADESELVKSLTLDKAHAQDNIAYVAAGIHLNVPDDVYDKIVKKNVFFRAIDDMLHAHITDLRLIFQRDWVLRADVQSRVEKRKKQLKLSRYLAIHIRRGDKVQGAAAESVAVDLAKWRSRIMAEVGRYKCNTLFVATDSADAVRDVRHTFPQLHIITTATAARRGFDQNTFNMKTDVAADVIDVIIDITFLAASLFYFGTSSSNITKLVRLAGQDRWCDMEPDTSPLSGRFKDLVNPKWVRE